MLAPEPGYTYAKFERPPLNSVCPKPKVKGSVKSENMSIISLEYVQKWKTVVYSLVYLTYLTILQSFDLIRYNFLLKLFDLAVTLKYGECH